MGGGGGVTQIVIRTATKQVRLRTKFGPNYTVFDVKKAYCDEHNNSVTPDKITLRRKGKELKPNSKTLFRAGVKSRIEMLTMSSKLRGGAFYEEKKNDNNVLNSNRNRKLDMSDSDIVITTKADCVTLDRVGQKKAQMPCGHAYCPDSMFGLLKSLMRWNEYDYEPKCSICKKIFDFELCAKVADLNDDEYLYFLQEIEKRASPETKPCPTCGVDCERPDSLKIFRVNCTSCSGGDWCFICGGKWYGGGFTVCGNNKCNSAYINITLRDCPLKETTYGTDGKKVMVPEMRACPKCLAFIDHSDACKHMTCEKCSHEFCFSCLKPKVNGAWTCSDGVNSVSEQCKVADRQVLK
eukprot:306022_1